MIRKIGERKMNLSEKKYQNFKKNPGCSEGEIQEEREPGQTDAGLVVLKAGLRKNGKPGTNQEQRQLKRKRSK